MGTALICKQLHGEWRAIARSRESRHALEALAAQEPVVAVLRCGDLGQLVDRVQRGRPDSLAPAEGAQVVAAMLHSSTAHRLIPRALVQTLYPGLTRVVRSLGGLQAHWGDLDSCFDEAVVVLWTVLDEWAGASRPFAGPDVLSAVRCRMRRQGIAGENERRRLSGLDMVEDTVPARPERSALEDLAVALSDPARLGISPADAATIWLTRVYGYSLEEVAAMAGTTRGSVQWRRERAEQCLVA
jgi:DNA-directed RNA polymerase specialized sigma24 family protein